MARTRLRCRLGRHVWTTIVDHGEERAVCRLCGKDRGDSDGSASSKPPMWGSTPVGYYPRE